MIYASVCDGIGAVHAAWNPLGWKCAWTAEIEAFPAAVVEHHWKLPNLGDITKITESDLAKFPATELLVGGTPCQSFSVAGLRGGLDDARGNLALRFLQLAGIIRPRWLVWENVPGVLSSNEGKDFGTILGALGELGYGFAYRILDAQYFGVPHRRRRVFIVGHLGDWRHAAAVLFERQSLSGNSPPRRSKGENIAPTISARTKGGGGLGTDFDCDGGLIAEVAPTLDASYADKWGLDNQHIDAGAGLFVGHVVPTMPGGAAQDGPGHGARSGDASVPLREEISNVKSQTDCQIHDGKSQAQTSEVGSIVGSPFAFQTRIGRNGRVQPKETVDALTSCEGGMHADSKPHIAGAFGVRRLTPRECERLQGFPDDYTAIELNGRMAADSPRYKALGNSMAVPVMRWLGERIELVESVTKGIK